MIPRLVTERLVLRAPEVADFGPFSGHYMSPRACYEGGPFSRDAAWKEFAAAAAGWLLRGYGSLSITDAATGDYWGEVGVYHLATSPAPEIGWMVLPEQEGRGVAAEAARALRGWAYGALGWSTLVSYVDPGNARSIRLAERLGARIDADAPYPDDDPCLVFRHPGPEAAA